MFPFRHIALAGLLGIVGCTIEARVDQGACLDTRERIDGRCATPPIEPAPPTPLSRSGYRTPVGSLDRIEDRCQLVVPSTVDLGSVPILETSETPIVLVNGGKRVCDVRDFVFGADRHVDFVVASRAISIAPGETKLVPIAFTPTAEGDRSSVLQIVEDGRVYRAIVAGVGRAPDQALAISPLALDFGPRRIRCRNGERYRVYISNPAHNSVRVGLQVVGGRTEDAFTVDTESHFELEAGGMREVGVLFAPSQTGRHWGRLSITTDDHHEQFVSLLGEGTETAALHEKFVGGEVELSLRATPAHATVRMLVEQIEYPPRIGSRAAWSVNYQTREVLFAPSFVPRPSATVEVFYDHVCTGQACGDGVLDPGEACDDGNRDDTDRCSSGCQGAFCGDGFILSGIEACDDGNATTGDGCNDFCQVEVCGNGYLEPPEQCDDGPLNSNVRRDACRLDCTYARCGDGTLDDGETCDDGNDLNSDACVSRCVRATCGDGFVWAGNEECDDGDSDNFNECDNQCVFPSFNVVPYAAAFFEEPTGTPVTVTSSVTLPFDFNFLGHEVTYLDVSTPGLVVFGDSAGGPQNDIIPTSTAPNGFIAWWWDSQLVADAESRTVVEVVGARPTRSFVIRFDRYGLRDARLSAEMVLFELDGRVTVDYGDAYEQVSPGATVGWESTDGLRGEDPLGCSPSCDASSWPSNASLSYER